MRREEVRLEEEPIDEAPAAEPPAGGAVALEEGAEVMLREEQVVVQKRVAPRERVRLTKQTVTEERQVAEEVRKERIEVDDSDLPPPSS